MKESIEQSALEILTEAREIQLAIKSLDKLSSDLEPPRGKYAKAILRAAEKNADDKDEAEAVFRGVMEELDEVARKVSEAGEHLAEIESDYNI
jgi:hypothetical protein